MYRKITEFMIQGTCVSCGLETLLYPNRRKCLKCVQKSIRKKTKKFTNGCMRCKRIHKGVGTHCIDCIMSARNQMGSKERQICKDYFDNDPFKLLASKSLKKKCTQCGWKATTFNGKCVNCYPIKPMPVSQNELEEFLESAKDLVFEV